MKNFDPGKTQVVGSDTRKIPAERLTASPNERYHNRNVIGSGGMKIVLQTDDLNVGRSIAMAISKDASPENSSGSSKRRALPLRLSIRTSFPFMTSEEDGAACLISP